MINNLHDQLKNFYNNRSGKNEAGGGAAELMKRLRDKQNAIRGGAAQPTEEQSAEEAQQAQTAKKKRPNYADSYAKSKNPEAKTSSETKDEVELSSEEKRQAALKKILDKLDAEEAAKYPNRVKNKDKDKTDATDKQDGVTTITNPEDASKLTGVEGFLNDMPLFNEFKTSLVDAFRSMDSATAGSISAQYELNYTSMQYIAAEGGGYEYKETSFNLKLDLNYVKAGAGGTSGSDIANAIEKSTDFASLMTALQDYTGKAQGAGAQDGQAQTDQAGKTEETKGIPGLKGMSTQDAMSALKDYFSPEATSGRIVDFASMFYPLSKEFKEGGDTEETRKAYADRMGKAIQKGFDQAIGQLGNIPKDTMDGINKTHELVFKGLEDFVKNGLNKEKEEQGVYDSLHEFAFSFEMSYSEKSVSVSAYNSRGQAQAASKPSSVNTEA